MRSAPVRGIVFAAALLGAVLPWRPASAWGPDGHRTIALIADRVLQQTAPATRKKVEDILAGDKDNKWTKHDIASEATWADVLREKSEEARMATAEWHSVRLNFDSPDLTRDCFNHKPLPSGYPASHGPRENCAVDKISQFEKELQNPETPAGERLTALQFLLNLVGDVHDPLHAIDHKDRQGHCVAIQVGAKPPTRLATYWGTTLVAEVVGRDPAKGATWMTGTAKPAEIEKWVKGDPADWAQETYQVAKTVTYSFLKAPPAGKTTLAGGKDRDPCGGPIDLYKVGPEYETAALAAVKEQLTKAGVRLSLVLRENLK